MIKSPKDVSAREYALKECLQVINDVMARMQSVQFQPSLCDDRLIYNSLSVNCEGGDRLGETDATAGSLGSGSGFVCTTNATVPFQRQKSISNSQMLLSLVPVPPESVYNSGGGRVTLQPSQLFRAQQPSKVDTGFSNQTAGPYAVRSILPLNCIAN